MGMCRGVNMALGATIGGAFTDDSRIWYAAVLYVFFVEGITYIARNETGLIRVSRIGKGGLLVFTAWAGLAVLSYFNSGQFWLPIITLFLTAGIVYQIRRALRSREPFDVQRAVRWLLVHLVVFDVIIILSAGMFVAGLAGAGAAAADRSVEKANRYDVSLSFFPIN